MQRRLRVLLILLLAFNHAIAQTETSASHTTIQRFTTYYNQAKFDSVFNMFSANMQQSFPLNKTIDFLTRLKITTGQVDTCIFEKYQSGYASYKVKCAKRLLSVNISIDPLQKITGFFVKPYVVDSLNNIRNTTPLMLPFKGEWAVFWGGDTKAQNYHIAAAAQKNAFDFFVQGSNGTSYKNEGKLNEDYYAFEKEIIAPCDGEVVLMVDGISDNKPGEMNKAAVAGNHIIIKTANNEYLFFAHFKQYSIKVTQGQQIKKGELLGLCGNSGNSSEPHLHFHIQNAKDTQIATGIKCYFQKLMVNGNIKIDYSPVKGDLIQIAE